MAFNTESLQHYGMTLQKCDVTCSLDTKESSLERTALLQLFGDDDNTLFTWEAEETHQNNAGIFTVKLGGVMSPM